MNWLLQVASDFNAVFIGWSDFRNVNLPIQSGTMIGMNDDDELVSNLTNDLIS